MSLKARSWVLFDKVVDQASARDKNPWSIQEDQLHFAPDYDTLSRLLAVPVALQAKSQSGVPALAFDVWVAYELRRAGFDPDAVWPRATAPRVLPTEISSLLRNLKGPLRDQLAARVVNGTGLGGAVGSSANLLGKNYVKQVDVVMSAWNTGPELMISTKRMDSSFGKNAANRVEESYGDAKNLRLRHPQAALGFVYSLHASAFTSEPDKAAWLIDLLTKLGREDDAYHAVALVVPDSPAVREPAEIATSEDDDEDPFALPGATTDDEEGFGDNGEVDEPTPTGDSSAATDDAVRFADTPAVPLRFDLIPADIAPDRFFRVMANRVLDNSPVNYHVEARRRRAHPSSTP